MRGKSFQAVIFVFAFTVPLLTGDAYAQQPSTQGISLEFTQQPWDATAGCPAAYTVEVTSQDGFQGVVNLTAVDSPDKVKAVFYPNPVEVPPDGKGSSYLAVMVLPDTPQGTTDLTVKGVSLPTGEVSVTSILTFNVGPPCGKQPRTAVTTTVATTIMATTTTTIYITTTVENTLTTSTDTRPVAEGEANSIINTLQSSSIGIGIAVAGITIALAISGRRRLTR